MAEYDLISDDDFFSELSKNKKDAEKKQAQQPPKDQVGEDDLFTLPDDSHEEEFQLDLEDEHAFGGQTAGPETAEESFSPPPTPEDRAEDFSESAQDTFDMDQVTQEEESEAPPASGSPETPYLTDDYIDEKQEGINYRPILIGTISIVLLALIFFLVKMYVFPSKSGRKEKIAKATKEVTASTKKAGPTPLQLKKEKFWNSLAGNSRSALGLISGMGKADGKGIKLSSILLYDKDLLFEVFAGSRAELAKYNSTLRENFRNKKISIVASDSRPGNKSGIFGLFKVDLNQVQSASTAAAKVTNPFKTPQEGEKWLQFLAGNSGLSIKDMNFTPRKAQDVYTIYELNALLHGSKKGCLQFIDAMGNSPKNIKLHKLILNALDQRTFNPARYQMRLILYIYS